MTSRRCAYLSVVLAVAAMTSGSTAQAQMTITRSRDGTITLSNVPRRHANSGTTTTVVSQGAPVVSTPSTGTSGALRDLYIAAAHDTQRFSRYDAYINEAATLYQLPVALVRAVMKQESDFNPYSVSSSGAAGLMQLMPETARSMNVTDVFDPRQNVLGGVRFLRVLANTFNGDLVLTVAAYNAGPNAVIRYAGVPPFEETQHYVRQVLRFYYMFRAGLAPLSDPADTVQARAVSASRTTQSGVHIRVDPPGEPASATSSSPATVDDPTQ